MAVIVSKDNQEALVDSVVHFCKSLDSYQGIPKENTQVTRGSSQLTHVLVFLFKTTEIRISTLTVD